MKSSVPPVSISATNNISDTQGATQSTLMQAENPTETNSIAELKKGKVVFKQKPMSLEKHSETLQEIVKFRDMLEFRKSQRLLPLDTVSEEYKSVLVKLVYESDKTLPAISKHIHQELLPAEEEEEGGSGSSPLTLSAVENGIQSVAVRTNYGLNGPSGAKAPNAVCVWRWEIKPAYVEYLPKNAREKAAARLAEREQAKIRLRAIFDSLPKSDQDALLDPKGTKTQAKDAVASGSNDIVHIETDFKTPTQASKKTKENEENDSTTLASKVGKPKKIPDPEKLAKERAKQEKKAAKVEREQKEKDAQTKSRSLMQNFFKTSARPQPTKDADTSVASTSVSEFDRTFKAFVIKKETALAPVNRFTEARKRNTARLTYDGDVIIVEDEDDTAVPEKELQRLSTSERLRTSLRDLISNPCYKPTRRRRSSLKTEHIVRVSDMMEQVNEAEVSGEVNLVRSLVSTLSDRAAVPAKVLVFADDARPGYFGTWTRNSRLIGPRTPLAQDVAVFDYGYDSGEEWEEELVGDADDVVEDGDDEDLDAEDADSDLDSWLADDDEDQVIEERGTSPVFHSQKPAKRRADDTGEKTAKKRKLVAALKAFAKGPLWEQELGQCASEIFNPYRIQILNDAPEFPIDPFSLVSPSDADATDDGFAVPLLPDRLKDLQIGTSAKRSMPTPKTSFPEAHLAFLLEKISRIQTGSFPILIDTIYQDLRPHKVKKNSIEAKVREVAEKCKVNKIWVLKDGLRASAAAAQ